MDAKARTAAKVALLRAWILALPYDRFHMIVECVSDSELELMLAGPEFAGSPKRVKARLREQARLWREQERNCAFE